MAVLVRAPFLEPLVVQLAVGRCYRGSSRLGCLLCRDDARLARHGGFGCSPSDGSGVSFGCCGGGPPARGRRRNGSGENQSS